MNRQDYLKEYKSDLRLQNKTDETIRRYLSCLKVYFQFLDDNGENFLELNKSVLRGFTDYLRNERNVKDRTLEQYFSSMNSFYDFLKYEGHIDSNIINSFRKRYLSDNSKTQIERQIPEPEELSKFINFIPKVRDKCINVVFAKTGIRRNELIDIDIDDIDFEEYSIQLKKKKKRSNRVVFFDRETARLIERYLKIRVNSDSNALFINEQNGRLKRHGVYGAVVNWAEDFGLHDSDSDKFKDKFTPHSYRHWFSTILRRNDMKREYIQELRGDSKNDAIDLYNHIDRKELKRAYLSAMPKLSII